MFGYVRIMNKKLIDKLKLKIKMKGDNGYLDCGSCVYFLKHGPCKFYDEANNTKIYLKIIKHFGNRVNLCEYYE